MSHTGVLCSHSSPRTVILSILPTHGMTSGLSSALMSASSCSFDRSEASGTSIAVMTRSFLVNLHTDLAVRSSDLSISDVFLR